jgi:hypothetical protein
MQRFWEEVLPKSRSILQLPIRYKPLVNHELQNFLLRFPAKVCAFGKTSYFGLAEIGVVMKVREDG